MAATKSGKKVDWAAIEPDWRAGIKSKKQLAAEYGVSRAAMDKHFAKRGVERDLSAKIKESANAKVTRDAVTQQVTFESHVTEREIVEANAELQANVIRSHRHDITRYRALCSDLLEEIELQTGERVTFEQLGEIMAEESTDRMNALFQKALSTPTRVDAVKKLVDTLKVLIGLERQAFGIADNANGDANRGKSPLDDLFNALSGSVFGATAPVTDDDDDDSDDE